jgi:phage FluMu protein gp41
LLARDVPLAFGFALLIRVSSWVCHIDGPWSLSQVTKFGLIVLVMTLAAMSISPAKQQE